MLILFVTIDLLELRSIVALLKLKHIWIFVKQHKTVGFPMNQSIRYTILYVGTYFLHSVHVYFKALFLFPNVHNSFLRVLFSTIFKSTFLYALFSSSILWGNKKSISFIPNSPYATQDMNMFSYFQARNIERQGTIKSDNALMVIHIYHFTPLSYYTLREFSVKELHAAISRGCYMLHALVL